MHSTPAPCPGNQEACRSPVTSVIPRAWRWCLLIEDVWEPGISPNWRGPDIRLAWGLCFPDESQEPKRSRAFHMVVECTGREGWRPLHCQVFLRGILALKCFTRGPSSLAIVPTWKMNSIKCHTLSSRNFLPAKPQRKHQSRGYHPLTTNALCYKAELGLSPLVWTLLPGCHWLDAWMPLQVSLGLRENASPGACWTQLICLPGLALTATCWSPWHAPCTRLHPS